MKGIYLRLVVIAFLISAVSVIQLSLAHSPRALHFYINNIFLPLQKDRNLLLNHIALSVGDILYLMLALLFLLLCIRLVYFACTFRKNKLDFLLETIRMGTFLLTVYFCFLVLWGGNYYRPRLSEQWECQNIKWDTTSLISLNRFLIDRMNELSKEPLFYPPLKTLNSQADGYYHRVFGNRLPPLKVKATALGYMLNYVGIHGYYNPLSGESQFNRFIPPFMHPFVVTHEMAHQAGIAAEDDANLLAYVIGVKSPDPAFRYSAYFNLFLYAYADLQDKDREAAGRLWNSLNGHSKSDIADLKEMYRKYKSVFRNLSNSLYDAYLRWNGQSKGLDSYTQVIRWVYYWEYVAKEKADILICPPL